MDVEVGRVGEDVEAEEGGFVCWGRFAGRILVVVAVLVTVTVFGTSRDEVGVETEAESSSTEGEEEGAGEFDFADGDGEGAGVEAGALEDAGGGDLLEGVGAGVFSEEESSLFELLFWFVEPLPDEGSCEGAGLVDGFGLGVASGSSTAENVVKIGSAPSLYCTRLADTLSLSSFSTPSLISNFR